MSATGQENNLQRRSLQAFTLVELILVMSVLTIAVAIAAPSMSSFFRGRDQEGEARRILSLIRYGQTRATGEGIPVLLWLDTKNNVYGLEQDPSYVEDDPKGVEFDVDSRLAIDTEMNKTVPISTRANSHSRTPLYANIRGRSLPAIRFLPDASFGSSSPVTISVSEGNSQPIWIAQSQNGLTYELENQNKKIQNAFR